MTQILNGRGESYIEKIISHRISANKSNYYEYHVKMSNTDSAIWLSEMEIIKLNTNLLKCYKKKAGLIALSGNDDENFHLVDFSKFIALNFNECMGIKLEIGVVCDEATMETSESIEQVTTAVKIKTENVEYVENESADNCNKMICNNSLKEDLITTRELNSSCLRNEPVIPEQNERNGDISQVPSNSFDLIDRFFDHLPIVSKVTNDLRNINKYSLLPLNLEILKDIIEKGDLDLLQNYMYSDQRESLENLISNYPCLFILAAKNDDLPIVSSLLSLGVNINSKDTDSKTALMFACENESESLIDLLVTNGASLNNINSNNDSILFFCCEKNKPKAIQILLNLGADFSRIKSDSLLSLNEYAKNMKLTDIQRIAEKHLSKLSISIKNVILLQLGGKLRLDVRIMPIYVISPFEIKDEIHLNFDINSKLLKKNTPSFLFILTGIIIGSEMKCFFSDCYQIKSVTLNDVEQGSLTQSFKTITTFISLKKQNKLSVKFENIKCRKTRIILAAYYVTTI